jgi:predicted DNA-binding protein
MTKSNLQIRIPDELLTQLEQVAGQTKSAFVREAISEKIRREQEKALETQWMKSLQKNPENMADTKAWLDAEEWGNK